jgi:type III restriction enzyme
VQFDNALLIHSCIDGLKEHFDKSPVGRTRLQWHKADITIGKSGVDAAETAASAPVTLDEPDLPLPDLLTELQDKTQLTRHSITKILIESGKLEDFKRNPQEFLEVAAQVIERVKRLAIVDGIKYQHLGDEFYYAQELFETEELSGYIKDMLAATKSVHEHVIHGSDVEATFADQLEKNEAVKVYAKLPGWFKVPTPLGSYNPDWAVLIQKDGEERLYFVVETKSSLFTDDLRSREDAKIRCGEAHFEALKTETNEARFIKATKIDDLMAHC